MGTCGVFGAFLGAAVSVFDPSAPRRARWYSQAMTVNDILATDGRVFLKSEWGPISDYWPAVSFSKEAVGRYLRGNFRPKSDLLFYVGTGDPKRTEQPEHRRRILSAIKLEPNKIFATHQLIPPESWFDAQKSFKGKWEFSLGVWDAWDVDRFPLASDVIPMSYSSLGEIQNWGNVVEVAPGERDALLSLEMTSVHLKHQPAALEFLRTRRFIDQERSVRDEIERMAAGICERENRSGTESTRTNAFRVAVGNISFWLNEKWDQQDGRCKLCGGVLVIGAVNKLLRPSPDRINSADPRYSPENVQITHLACNLAKNDVNPDEFREWLDIARGSHAPAIAASAAGV
jgi:hypothetical protein